MGSDFYFFRDRLELFMSIVELLFLGCAVYLGFKMWRFLENAASHAARAKDLEEETEGWVDQSKD